MPYIDPTGENPGWSEDPQPGFGLTAWADEPPTPPIVPASVTKYQACVVLARHQLLAQTSAFFSNMGADDPRRLAWEMAATVHRHSASTLDAIQHLGLSASQADAMFVEAAQVE
ncbi:hypothetical protein LMG7053_04811 [Achromobacter ruhlandii]|uniref:Uncharacterized protein n=1 Tax=Achromobacter ruhlandii TaxID=72557 RepID=A0ABM8M1L3_9BURK|nr:hypothetical protein [Achromobacter ruhlandii]CAB3955807.1 hypothetical protein LMG7053_04811 [Achromobacter ruhlandii]